MYATNTWRFSNPETLKRFISNLRAARLYGNLDNTKAIRSIRLGLGCVDFQWHSALKALVKHCPMIKDVALEWAVTPSRFYSARHQDAMHDDDFKEEMPALILADLPLTKVSLELFYWRYTLGDANHYAEAEVRVKAWAVKLRQCLLADGAKKRRLLAAEFPTK